MTPPKAPLTSDPAGEDAPSAGSLRRAPSRFEVLTKRADFLRAARARRVVTPGFILQIRACASDGPMRVGFTCSKKVGNAVARNRAKRRLREIARLELPRCGIPGTDYVLIGRADITATRPFDQLRNELRTALGCDA
ncbi:ribonuclease P protein component [uncultured Tateyamaria sp.]|uniref:ribonuclease P protein component n=1 Tax=Tateyamaria sp. TaxID=1929288 RepID=UPI00262813F1|nr:ribonuclease P protein component [uncultured Tateyamaria sp.]